jgi:hypothetical protein
VGVPPPNSNCDTGCEDPMMAECKAISRSSACR